MTSHADAAHAHHGPPIANRSSRIDAATLGMFLFIASEAMLFGSFFTAYFFVRVVNPGAPDTWPPLDRQKRPPTLEHVRDLWTLHWMQSTCTAAIWRNMTRHYGRIGGRRLLKNDRSTTEISMIWDV